MNTTWVLRTARREARRAPSVLLSLLVTVAIGVAGVFGVAGFRAATDAAISSQAQELLGGDLVVMLRREFPAPVNEALAKLGAQRVTETSFGSMVLFPATGATRLAQIVGVGQGFPLYGEIAANPPDAAARMLAGDGALVDSTLLIFFDAKVGDRLKIGELEVPVAGELRGVPGTFEFRALVAPRIYLSASLLAKTQLLQKGSAVKYQEYLKLPRTDDPVKRAESIQTQLRESLAADQPQIETAADRQTRLSNSNRSVARFLYLLTCVSLILCGLGVASSVQTFLRTKSGSIATLRCLGATALEAVSVFVAQILAGIGAGVAIGLVLGYALQEYLKAALADLLPTSGGAGTTAVTQWLAVVQAAGLSLVLIGWFSIPQIFRAYQISASQSLRTDVEGEKPHRLLQLLFLVVAIVLVVGCAIIMAESVQIGATLGGSVAGAMVALLLLARFVLFTFRKTVSSALPFAVRQGLANLSRPFNQTTVLLLSISAATYLFLTVYYVRQIVGEVLSVSSAAGEPNLVVFDAQRDQLSGLRAQLSAHGLTAGEPIPIVAMRLQKVKGEAVQDRLKRLRDAPPTEVNGYRENNDQRNRGENRWELTRLYRSSYRNTLAQTESLASGTLAAAAPTDGGPVPVSVEVGIAKELGVAVGDTMEFDIQGVALPVVVGSIRNVDWQRFRANFFVIFPPGVLETAPQTFLIMAHAATAQESALLQRDLVQQYPNVSIIDVRLVQETIDRVLARIQTAVRLMGGFAMCAAIVVLLAAVINTRNFRRRENAILKVMGASMRTVVTVTAVEYLLLSSVAVTAALALAHGGTAFIGYYYFGRSSVPFSFAALGICFAVSLLCTVIGVWGSASTFRVSPASVLRS